MNVRFASVALLLACAACSRSSSERETRIAKNDSETMRPASRTMSSEEAAKAAPRGTVVVSPMAPTGESEISSETPSNDRSATAEAPTRSPDVIYVPTPQPVVEKLLEVARVRNTDLLYDLGCGDGRIVVTAAQRYGARAVGFDIDPVRVAEARENVKKHGLEKRVTIEHRDIFTVDLSPASVVTLYLLPKLNDRLVPSLEKLAPGSRVVSHDFDISGVIPESRLDVRPTKDDRDHRIYSYVIPFRRTTEPSPAIGTQATDQ